MAGFVSGNGGFMLQSESDVIEPLQQTVPHEVVDRKGCRESSVIMHPPLLEVDSDLIALHLSSPSH